MRILFTGGGSGGHFYPLMAIAQSVRGLAVSAQSAQPELYYMGPDPYDASALIEQGIAFVYCPSGKIRRYASLLNVIDSFTIMWGVLVAIWKLFSIYPDVVMSKGSHTSVPVILAAAFLRIPIVIHESDAAPGRANKLAARYARYIAISYPDAAQHFKGKEDRLALTGIPLRATPPFSPHQSERPLISVFGGSSGALRLNNLIIEALPELLTSYDVFHQTGKEHEAVVAEMAKALVHDDALRSHYRPVGFIGAEEMSRTLADSSVVISRAGSNSIAEIARAGKPAILIPIPEDVSHDQLKNAYAYAREGGATVMEERNLTPHLLTAEIARILQNPDVEAHMKAGAAKFVFPHAADTLARALIEISHEHSI